MTFVYRDGVAVGEIVFYTPLLVVALILAFRHGFGRSSGWLFLNIFALIRIIGAVFQLLTISSPTNVTYLTGAAILEGVGLSPLILTTLGLLSRIISNINLTQHTIITPTVLKGIQLLVTVGLILGIVGGIDSSDALQSTGKYVIGPKTVAGSALFIVAYVAILITVALLSTTISYAELAEKRLYYAICATLPFLAVRVAYSAIGNIGKVAIFSSSSGNVTILLVMSLIMELIVVITYEAVGLLTPKEHKYAAPPVATHTATGAPMAGNQQTQYDGAQTQYTAAQAPYQAPYNGGGSYGKSNNEGIGGTLGRLGRRTIIGRIITSATNSRGNDVEMGRR